jgi:hypothetical protein
VTSPTIDSLAIFSRNPLTGAIAHLPGIDGCYSETGSNGICRNGRALDVPWQVTVSPDGRHVYVASQTSNGVPVFAPDGRTVYAAAPASDAVAVLDRTQPARR